LKTLLAITLFLISSICAASSLDTVLLLQTSTSGKTLIVNKGSNHQIESDDYGVLLKQVAITDAETKITRKVYKPVAKLKAVKVFQETSVWVTLRSFMPKEMVKDSRLILLSEAKLLMGRTDYRVRRNSLVGTGKVAKELEETLLEDGQFLAKKRDRYKEVRTLHDKEKHHGEDVELIDVEQWEDKTKSGKYSRKSIYKSPYVKEFSKRKRIDTFEKMVYSFLKKYNDPKFTMKSMYHEQRRIEGMSQLQDAMVGGNVFDTYVENLSNKKAKEEKFYSDMLEKGESWSDDYSDEELSELLYNVGVIREKERREEILAFRYDYQAYFSAGINLLDNQLLSDGENSQDNKYDFEIGAETYFLKGFEYLRQFTLELSLRRAEDGLNTGNVNAISLAYSGALHINWYPFHPPNTIERNVVYMGMLFRTGVSALMIKSNNEVGNYQLMSIPGFRMGVKYNFSNSYGLRMTFAYENIRLDRIAKDDSSGALPDRENYLDGKLTIGLSKFF
jgi:hypothetical protein